MVVMASYMITKVKMTMRRLFLPRDPTVSALMMARTTAQSLQVPKLDNLPRVPMTRKVREVGRESLLNSKTKRMTRKRTSQKSVVVQHRRKKTSRNLLPAERRRKPPLRMQK